MCPPLDPAFDTDDDQMTPGTPALRRALALTAALALLPIATAADTPAPWPPDDTLIRYPEEIRVPQEPGLQEALQASHPGLRDLTRNEPSWRATLDPRTAAVDRAFGRGIPLDAPDGDPSGPERAARSFLARHRGLLPSGIAIDDDAPGAAWLAFDEAASRPLAGGDARVLTYRLVKDGLPVLGAGLSLGVREDAVVLIASSALGPVATPSRPRLDATEALAAVERHAFPQRRGILAARGEPTLAFLPMGAGAGASSRLAHRLVWVMTAKPEEAPFWTWHVAWVDARDGRIHAFFPEAQTAGACQSDPARAHARVLGGVRPVRADDPEVIMHLPSARVDVNGTRFPSDLNGRYPYTGGNSSSALDGDFFRMRCDNCSGPADPFAQADTTGDIDFGLGGASSNPPIFGNGRSTPADRTTFLHLNEARDMLLKWNSVGFERIDAFVNIASTCNAFSAAHLLGFFVGGGGCRNTGEIRGVVQHELGHTWDRMDGNDITNGRMSEWKGDALAMLMGGTSCIAPSFRVVGGPTTACSGVRDIDEKAPGRTDHPATADCPTCATLKRTANNCGGPPHCWGEIVGQASWHLLNNMISGVDYITGSALPAGNPALPTEQARWTLERLIIGGGPPMQTWDPTATGLSVYDAFMLMDDDDANLANGTPHAAYINAAFSHHQIAETPQVTDAPACAALADPMVATSVETDPQTGLPQVRIDWTPVGGATSFDVYRNRATGDGFLPVAQNVASGPVIDRGVQEGMTYRYFVAAVRKTGCATISPGANIVAATIDRPTVRIASRMLLEAPGGSDGDGRFEPGERVLVQVTLKESGGLASASGVAASLSSKTPNAPVVAGGPIAYGGIPAGGTTLPPSSFEVFLAPDLACGQNVDFVLSASGNEGCWLDGLRITLDNTAGCAPSPAAFVAVVPGSVAVTAPGGDADGIADNCEAASVTYDIRNVGSLASGAAGAAVTTSHAGVTFSPTPSCSVTDLAPGASATCGFAFSLGGASSTGIGFTLTADSAGNAAPSSLPIVVPTESNAPVFSTLSYTFDGTLQGWTGQQFAPSTTRVFAGTHSARAGSTIVPNLCARLTSPPLLLDPAGGSTLSFRLYVDIEPITDQWYDRANVHVVDLETRQHTVINPVSGPAYNAAGNEQGGLCHVANETAWAGLLGGFNLTTFDLSPFAGRRVQIEINYDTDELDDREGIYVDSLSITNATTSPQPADSQPDVCFVPEVSAPAAPVPLDVAGLPGNLLGFTWQDLGPGFQYNLYAGTLGTYFSHGAGQVRCSGLGAGVSCDGIRCTLQEAISTLPAGDLYFLTTGTGFGIEGTSGFTTAPAERDPGQSSCAP